MIDLPDINFLNRCRFLYKKWRLAPNNETNSNYIYINSISDKVK